MLVEHPVRNDFHLVDTDKPAETASDFYRFEVKVAGRQDGNADRHRGAHHQRAASQLTNSNDDQIRFFINQPVSQPEGQGRPAEGAWTCAGR